MTKQSYEEGRKSYTDRCQHLKSNIINDIKNALDNSNIDVKTYCKSRLESCFEDMFLYSLNFISNVYGINTDWIEISENVVLELTFSGDGKNFYDRINDHYSEYMIDQDKDKFLNSINSIINSESKYIFNHALSSQLKDSALECEIIGDNACGECADHLGGGRINPKLLTDLPPYHPNCECYIKYYFNVDDSEEVSTDNI